MTKIPASTPSPPPTTPSSTNQIGMAAAVSIGIGGMVGAAFLLVYAVVNAGHLLVLKQTGAHALIVWLSLLTCLAIFVMLAIYTYQQQPLAITALIVIAVASFLIESLYRGWTGRKIHLDR